MSIISGIILYSIIWTVVLFVILPFGISVDNKNKNGFASSAPINPHIGKKLIFVFFISVFLWGVIFLFFVSDHIIL